MWSESLLLYNNKLNDYWTDIDESKTKLVIIDATNKELPYLITQRWGVEFNVPLLLEAKIGDNWLDTKDVI